MAKAYRLLRTILNTSVEDRLHTLTVHTPFLAHSFPTLNKP